MVPWDRECSFDLPVQVWRDLMNAYFPGAGWLRLSRRALDALRAFKHQRALPTWDDAVNALLEEAE
jgi:hypothetical protein